MTAKNNTLRKKILKGLELYYERLIQTKSDRNLKLVVSENGKVVYKNPKLLLKEK